MAPRLQTGFNAIRESDLRSNLTFIAGDGLEGRMSLQPGDDAAAEWVAAEFAKAGLEPAATDASGKPSFLQPVPLIEYKPDPTATTLSLSRKDAAPQQWHAPVVSCAFRNNVEVSGGLVYVGYGITAAELNYDDYANVDVRGKIVLILAREPQASDPNSKFKGKWDTLYSYAWSKAEQLQKAGVAGILMIDPSKPQRPPRVESGPPDYMQPGTPSYGQSLTTNLWDTPFFDLTEQAANEILARAKTHYRACA